MSDHVLHPTAREGAEHPLPLMVSLVGPVTPAARDTAIAKVAHVLARVERPVLAVDLRLQQFADPARERPALARVSVDLGGPRVRARVAGATMVEAADLLADRLRERLRHLVAHRVELRRRRPAGAGGGWRHRDAAVPRSPVHPRPVDERDVVRHKSFTTGRTTVDEAVFDLEVMDHDFFLFTDAASGQDALVHRHPGGTYGLRHLRGAPGAGAGGPWAAAIEVDHRPAAELTLEGARERLDAGHEPWVFFADTGTGRGHVLYRRHDGHYGLITPVDEPDGPG